MGICYNRALVEIRIIRQPVPAAEVAPLAAPQLGDMTKAVVDVARGVLAVGGELHADAEAALLEAGSAQADLWGINLYPGQPPATWLEFDSMINIRPPGNRSRGVEDPELRRRIEELVARLLPR